MGNWKNGLYCYLTVDILISFPEMIPFFSIVRMATKRLKSKLQAFIAVFQVNV